MIFYYINFNRNKYKYCFFIVIFIKSIRFDYQNFDFYISLILLFNQNEKFILLTYIYHIQHL